MAPPTPQYMLFHKHGQAFIWCVICDLAILFGTYSYRKYSFYIHAILGTLAIGISFGLVLQLLIMYGMYLGYKARGQNLAVHAWIGVSFVILAGLVIIFGVITRILKQNSKVKSILVYIFKKVHITLGLCLYLASKTNILIGYSLGNKREPQFWAVIAWEIVMIFIYLFRKLFFPQLQNTINIQNDQVVSVIDEKDLNNKYLKYVIFSNNVYDIGELLTSHPGGYEVIEKVNGRQVDRFLYGMYSAQLVPELGLHSHSSKALQLVGKPIGKIKIQSPFKNLPEEFVASVVTLQKISNQGNLYKVCLAPIAKQDAFSFAGYSSVKQLGQYFTLNIDDKTTRLYTSVHFLQNKNIQLFEQICQELKQPQNILRAQQNLKPTNHLHSDVNMLASERGQQMLTIPLLIKEYPKGKLSPVLLNADWNGKIRMSSPKGLGLRLSTTEPGKIIVVAGGTGINPFLDLIDLLFKNYLINKKHSLSDKILEQNPILNQKPFEGYTFQFFIAIERLSDLHKITLYQINQLSKYSGTFKTVFRMKQGEGHNISNEIHQIRFTQEKFETLLINSTQKEEFSKIWICGPPAMNTSIAKALVDKGFTKEKFLLI